MADYRCPRCKARAVENVTDRGAKHRFIEHREDCRIGAVLAGAFAPIDETDYLDRTPYGYEPVEQYERGTR